MTIPSTTYTVIEESTSSSTPASRTPGHDWKLDDDGDLIIPLQFTRGIKAVAQAIRLRLELIRGELFLDRLKGIPYLPNDYVSETDAILGGKFQESKMREEFRKAITSAPGVIQLLELELSFSSSTRVMVVSWTVKADSGFFSDSMELAA